MTLGTVPLAADAARGYALGGTPIFAGPGNDFPVVAQLGSGVAVNINGCVADYSWCDVSFGPNRGWVYAGDLATPYRNDRVTVVDYGSRLALPIVTFSLGTYWDRHYRGRNFYGERHQWEQRWHDHDHARAYEHGGRDVRTEYRGDRDHRDDRSYDQRDRGHNNGRALDTRDERNYRGGVETRAEQHHESGNEAGSR